MALSDGLTHHIYFATDASSHAWVCPSRYNNQLGDAPRFVMLTGRHEVSCSKSP